MDTFSKVKEVILEKLSCSAEDVKLEASLKDDLGADSLDAVELIMSLEDAFGVSVPADKAEELNTVGDTVALMDSLR